MTQDSAIVKITSKQSENHHFGTGFVIYNDKNAAFVITCAHVVKDVGGSGHVLADDYNADVIVSGEPKGGIDIAVLKVKKLSDKPPLTLRMAEDDNKHFIIKGFQKHPTGSLNFTEIHCQISKREPQRVLRGTETFNVCELLMDEAYYLDNGNSGSPLICNKTGHVLAIVSHKEGRGEKGYAIFIEALEKIWPDMLPNLITKSKLFIKTAGQRFLMNLEQELDTFKKIATGQDKETKLILIHGKTGMGKTRLRQEYELIAKENSFDNLTILFDPKNFVEDYIC